MIAFWNKFYARETWILGMDAQLVLHGCISQTPIDSNDTDGCFSYDVSVIGTLILSYFGGLSQLFI
jgi:hypothetical protein